ncbi:hypothetical protein DFH09DRAFT_1413358 [Mycena vulgaris]|nr:hypothetical protein DFH09DRAFT_1413358 [Mycena vulgaris]
MSQPIRGGGYAATEWGVPSVIVHTYTWARVHTAARSAREIKQHQMAGDWIERSTSGFLRDWDADSASLEDGSRERGVSNVKHAYRRYTSEADRGGIERGVMALSEDIQNSYRRRHLPLWNVPCVGKAVFRNRTRVPSALFSPFPPTTTTPYLHRPTRRKRVKMATEGGAASNTLADQEYIGSLSPLKLMEFRNYIFSSAYINNNAAKFLDYEWVDISDLRNLGSSARQIEPTPLLVTPGPLVSVKAEPEIVNVLRVSDDIRMRTLNEGGREVFELFSDSEPEHDDADSDVEVMEALQCTFRSSSAIPLSDAHDFPDDNSDAGEPDSASEGSADGDDSELLESDTVWASDDGTSRMRIGDFRVTQKISVKRMEYREGPGEKAVPCRRIRYDCKGAHACDQLDTALLTVARFELDDPAPRKAIIVAQQETRRREGNTPEERVALFVRIIRNAKCQAVDSKTNKCRGGPILKPKPRGPSRGHQLLVGCSGWTPKFQQGHRTHSIPDDVDEDLLANALAGLPVTDDSSKDTPPRSGIIHPHTGLKKKLCCTPIHFIRSEPADLSITHAHIVKGMPVQGRIKNYPCDVTRSIYIPKDMSVRKVLIVHNITGHNHPMPALTKVSFSLKDTYPGCVEDYGVLGATVSKVDNDMKISSRASSSFVAELLDDPGITSFDGDTTYKGIEGKLNEWELTIFARVVQRAASVVRAYINGASADFFELLFDELQRVKREVTGKPLPFKTFIPDGNLLVTNVDMDAAHVIGLCRSVLKFSDPEYSGIPQNTPPEQAAPKFIKVCWRHGKEPVHEFRSLVSVEQHARIQDVFYIDSKESLDAFSSFLYSLGVQKITDWWRHKQMHHWIIPCLVKSQSSIPSDIWDSTPSTTNTNEAQHHWTNTLTGINRRVVDQNVAQEIEMSLETGILSNPNNEISHRMARSSQRQSNAARKARESHQAANISKELQLQINAEAEKRRVSNELTKSLKEQLNAAKGKSIALTENSAAPMPVHGAQSDNASLSAGGKVIFSVSLAWSAKQNSGASIPARETQLDIIPSATIAPAIAQSSEPPMAEFQPAAPSDSTFDLLHGMDFNFNWLAHDLAGANNESSHLARDPATAEFLAYDPAVDPNLFAEFNTLIPSIAPPADPLQNFMDLYGTSSAFFDAGAPTDFGSFSAGSFDEPLPLLPPPPPESPPAAVPPVEQVSEPDPSLPRSHRPRKKWMKRISSIPRVPEPPPHANGMERAMLSQIGRKKNARFERSFRKQSHSILRRLKDRRSRRGDTVAGLCTAFAGKHGTFPGKCARLEWMYRALSRMYRPQNVPTETSKSKGGIEIGGTFELGWAEMEGRWAGRKGDQGTPV